MTQHPFDREFSEEEAAKLNAEQEQANAGDELNEDELEDIAGGGIPIATDGIFEGGGFPTKKILEGGGKPWKGGDDIPTKQ